MDKMDFCISYPECEMMDWDGDLLARGDDERTIPSNCMREDIDITVARIDGRYYITSVNEVDISAHLIRA